MHDVKSRYYNNKFPIKTIKLLKKIIENNQMDLSFISEDLRDEIQKIEEDILFILDQVHNNRQYINKHFQNCMVNYFLRNLNFPLLSDIEPSYTCSKTMNNAILQKYINSEGAIYLKLMNGYLQEIQILGKLQLYRQTLVEMIMITVSSSKYRSTEKGVLPESDLKNNKEYQSEIWKKAFSLFLLFHSYNQNIKGIFEIWNSLFPHNQITRKRKQNINHVIVVPTRSQSQTDKYINASSDQQKQEQQEEDEEEEVQQSSDTISPNLSSFESENTFFLNLTQCCTNLHFKNNTGDISFLRSSENQEIYDMYDHQLNMSLKKDYLVKSNATGYAEINPTFPLLHQRNEDASDESQNSSIFMIQRISSKLKNEKRHTPPQNSCSLGRKIIKLDDKDTQDGFFDPFQQIPKLPFSEESILDIQDSIGGVSSSLDPINQIYQDQKNSFQS
ncbi:hypothetical protein TTHERM_00052730 (macronuclear) [Tetrahymena thermophila SB210]|uniref:Uncharacterized protein n=1 Tax=Tetrahymena thermophila (strain SB210) TaxID=312017 RepID=Q23CR7_TETTS|nr:hypothetical protein TTHERM_00052730 [Tetrahymena thermophila SB210]EAR94638.2 hypothetical protein TTHERM_00052730 [Tetrahymena thermophila SB210]|eukprot:XP_001014969.2 hypothetical protein TTHERM_00052730 [Tetrahymena thermophila SB210]